MRVHVLYEAILIIGVGSGRTEAKERATFFTQYEQRLLMSVCEGHQL